MLHTKFHENRLTGSGEEAFGRVLPYMGVAAILVKFRSPYQRRLHIKIGSDWPNGFGGDDL